MKCYYGFSQAKIFKKIQCRTLEQSNGCGWGKGGFIPVLALFDGQSRGWR